MIGTKHRWTWLNPKSEIRNPKQFDTNASGHKWTQILNNKKINEMFKRERMVFCPKGFGGEAGCCRQAALAEWSGAVYGEHIGKMHRPGRAFFKTKLQTPKMS